jgi:uncharacterized protein YndB with AHSA1/START domain
VLMENTPLMGRSLEKELFINATPQRVFQALTEPAELERWFVQKAEVEVRPGGRSGSSGDRTRSKLARSSCSTRPIASAIAGKPLSLASPRSPLN